ncbi:YhcN/YlaJ family sporulation lipoprotein [Paenisporosarcina sp. OV554]|uniref:YhcN/YlaJ family sporulation lipoprotein n=1 Tax=Paenisporosarcina sp. OV554 TaxID=2135694 RepID=UPI000D336F7F|nr:YhcN/YlaJ family sporulation lipoprotein [Paenisporosarcina sp. OV554]PUB16586.1 YhcN/YlaJ family sporulation lipoprotein [Paenisporosarcina sp. OV554]
MKKIWMLLSATLLCIALMGCGNKDENNTATNTENNGGVAEKDADIATDDKNLELAQDASAKIDELEEVDSSTVIVTENNAYVAIVLNKNPDGSEIAEGSKELEQIEDKIGEKVKEVNADVDNVYVSINPDFVSRMDEYRKKVEQGKPVEGLFEEFGELTQRIFPDAK